MADISMCKNKECVIKEKCYRYMATPNPYRQSYADFQTAKDFSDREYCVHFIDMESNK